MQVSSLAAALPALLTLMFLGQTTAEDNTSCVAISVASICAVTEHFMNPSRLVSKCQRLHFEETKHAQEFFLPA